MRELRSFVGKVVLLGRRADESARHRFVVDVASGPSAVLRPSDAEAKLFASGLFEGTELTIAVPLEGANGPGGVVRGELVAERWSAAQRMLIVSNPPSLEHVQRRELYRVPVAWPVQVGVHRGRLAFLDGETVDVSNGGFAARLREPVAAGEAAVARLCLPDRPLLAVIDVVHPGDGAAAPTRARFDQLAAADAARLSAALRRAEVAAVRTSAR